MRIALALAFALAPGLTAEGAAAQLLEPSGTHAVGTAVYSLVDPARAEPAGGRAGRRLMLQLWYPAAAGKGAPAAYLPDAGALDSMLVRGYNRLESSELRPLRQLRTHARRDAAPLSGERRPVLVLSHGHGISRSNYTALAEELASRGYLVATVDHPYGGFVVYPDGRAATLADEVADVSDDSVLSARTLEWARDASFVLDQLGDARTAPGHRFARVADARRAGMLGHSLGGAAALEACRLDERFLACADLDGLPFGPVRERGGARPIMVMLSHPDYSDQELAAKGRTREQWEVMGRARYATFDSIFARSSSSPGYVVEIRGTAHMSFSDAPFVLPSMITRFGGTPIEPARGHALVSAYLGDFFDRYLRGGRGALLNAAAERAPEVRLTHYGAARSRLSLAECRVADSVPARCGSYRVHEDRAARAGREIELNLVVVPARSATPARDPVFILAGGPGQVATDLVPMMMRRLAGVHRDRDIVFIDQRGTGGSNALVCPNAGEGMTGYGPAHDAYWAACLTALQRTADVRHYTTAVAVDDFDEVRAALGYERVNLIGGSYGTRVAQVYLARHPERVRSAVLWAVAPIGYDIPLDGGLAVQAAVERLLADCRADAACAAAYPRLGARLDSLLAGLAAQPRVVSLPGAEGDSVRAAITPDLFAQAIITLLYDAGHLRRIPALVERTARGEWAPVAGIAAQILAAQPTTPDALYLSVVCAEDVPHIRRERMAEFSGHFGALLRESAEHLLYRCARWPKAVLVAGAERPVRSAAPVLLLSGEADPATPPRGAEQALAYLSNARHVEVPATSHGPFFPGCVPEVVATFIAAPEPARLDATCVRELEWAPFAVAK